MLVGCVGISIPKAVLAKCWCEISKNSLGGLLECPLGELWKHETLWRPKIGVDHSTKPEDHEHRGCSSFVKSSC